MTTQDAFVAVCAVWRLCEHRTGRLRGCARAVCFVHDHDRGTRDLEPAKLLRLRPKNRLYEEHGSRGARSSCLDRTGRSGRVVYVHDRSPFSHLASRFSVGAGRLAECESLLLCVTTPSVRAFRPSDARCWLQRVSGAGPSPGGVQHPVPVRRVHFVRLFLRFSVAVVRRRDIRV